MGGRELRYSYMSDRYLVMSMMTSFRVWFVVLMQQRLVLTCGCLLSRPQCFYDSLSR